MIRLLLLGTPSLVIDGESAQGRSAQRKRIGLLAILAEATPSGISRERLVGLLWPDSDPAKARRVLSEALYVLKKELGEEVVRVQGETVTLNRDLVWCDLQAMRDALEEGRLGEAAGLYRGPFLEGFTVGDSPDFEHWSDLVRDQVASRYKDALLQLAEGATARRDPSEAARHYRSLAAVDPYNSAIALGLMRALAAAGDRASALTHARVHAQLLREEFDAEPSPDVEALAEALRDSPDPMVTSPASAPPPPAPSPSAPPGGAGLTAPPGYEGLPATPAPGAPEPTTPPPALADGEDRRTGWLTVGAVSLVGAVLLGWALLGPGNAGNGGDDLVGDPGNAPVLGRTGDPPVFLAVFPVQPVPGEGPAAEAAAQATQLLRMDLEIGNIRSVDGGLIARAYRAVAEAGFPGTRAPLPATPGELGSVTTRAGWDLFVDADLVLAGDRIVLEGNLWAPGQTEALASGQVEGPPSDLRILASELSTTLLEGFATASGLATAPQARSSTSSLAALRHWVQGEGAFLEGRYEDAIVSFEQAAEEDPDFAWAWYRLSASYLYSLRFLEAHAAAGQATATAAALPPHRATVVRAWEDFLKGNIRDAEAGFARVLEVDPDDPEALFGLGELRSHYNGLVGRPPDEGRNQFEAVLEVYGRHGETVHHLLEDAARVGDWTRFRDLLSRLPEDGDQVPAWRAVLAFGEDGESGGAGAVDGTERSAALQGLRNSEPLVVAMAAARVAAHLHDFPGAEEIAEILMESPLPGWRAAGWVVAAEARAARGDFSGARAALGEVERYQPTWATELATLFHLLYRDWDGGIWDAPELLAALAELDTEPANSEALLFLVHAGEHDEITLYLQGALAIQQGEGSTAEPSALLANARGEGDTSVRLASELAASQRAMLRLVDGDSPGAREALWAAVGNGERLGAVERVGLSPFFGHTLDRWTMGKLLASGQDTRAEARVWLDGLTAGFDILMAAPSHLQKARALEAEGEPAAARSEYEAFLREWDGIAPGSPGEELLREAEEALQRLGPA